LKNDRNRNDKKKVGAGHHRASSANGKARSKASGNHGHERAQKKAGQASANSKSSAKTSPASAKKAPAGTKAKKEREPIDFQPIKKKSPVGSESSGDSRLIEKAQEWARLHRNPETRSQMDRVLSGLSEADKRKVYLCGQRIAGGLSVKLVK